MSRANQSEILENPCKKYLKWTTLKETIIVDGDEVDKIKGGTWQYYDKDKEEKVNVKLPLTFAILNQDLVAFKGYDEKKKRGVWSNEVKDKDHVVVLRAKDEKLLTFKLSEYKLNKDAITGLGGKYTKSVYIGVEVNGAFEIWNLQLSGSSLTGAIDMENPNPDEKEDGWFGFTKVNKAKLYTNFVDVAGFKPKKKGTSKFTIPVYGVGDEIDQSTSDRLNELDKELSAYLDYYFDRPAEVPVEKEEHADVTDY
jgi:hypothetical protein